MLAYIYTPNGVSLILNGKNYSIAKDDVRYNALVEGLEGKFAWSELEELLAPPVVQINAALLRYGYAGTVSVDEDNVYFRGEPLHNTLTVRILQYVREGIDVSSLVRFLEKLMDNPSYRAVQDLYTFLEVGKIPLTEDGDFLVYKAVNSDWKDIYSGKFDNSIGSVVEIPRNQVDEDINRTCSRGLHVCSFDYLPSFAHADGHVVVCKVNPADVVAIPADYKNTKMRVSRYEVIGEVDGYYRAKQNVLSDSLVNNDYIDEMFYVQSFRRTTALDDWTTDDLVLEEHQECDDFDEAFGTATEMLGDDTPIVKIFDRYGLRRTLTVDA